jgi:hypothetical protein
MLRLYGKTFGISTKNLGAILDTFGKSELLSLAHLWEKEEGGDDDEF